MKWIKASEFKFSYNRVYYARWGEKNDEAVVKSIGRFQKSDGTFFWKESGYIPVLKEKHSELYILDETESPSPQSSTGVEEMKDTIKEICCDFMWESIKPSINDGYQSVRKLFDGWLSQNNYHKNKLAGYAASSSEGEKANKSISGKDVEKSVKVYISDLGYMAINPFRRKETDHLYQFSISKQYPKIPIEKYGEVARAIEKVLNSTPPTVSGDAGDDWISVENGLPEDKQHILFMVVSDNNYMRLGLFLKTDQWDRPDIFCDGSFFSKSKVTHWRPLPAPPKQ